MNSASFLIVKFLPPENLFAFFLTNNFVNGLVLFSKIVIYDSILLFEKIPLD
jgi:hypothetical protein